MRLRLLTPLLATAMGATALLAPPAAAVPAGPGVSTLDVATAGAVSGTVSSDQPYVFVGLSTGSETSALTKVTLADSTAFSLPTWGYGAGTSVVARACPADVLVEEECSPATSVGFAPTDVVPAVTWFDDTTVGPDDPDPVITVSDPDGGGVLVATHRYGSSTIFTTTIVEPGEPTSIPVEDAYWGEIEVQRCAAVDLLRCTAFNPAQVKGISVIKQLDFSVSQKVTASSTRDGSFRLQMVPELPGTATITWHVEDPASPGIPVGAEQSTTGPSQLYGYLPTVTVPRAGLTHGSYRVVGEVDFAADPAGFGDIDDQPFTVDPFVVDTIAPTLAVSANVSTIYPNINTTKRPGKVSWSITGTGHQDIGRAEVRSSGGTLIRTASVTTGSTRSVVQFDGRTGSGSWSKSVPSGYYKLLLWDEVGNPIAKYGVVKVDARRLVTKTWRKTVSSAGSVVDQYVGKCSTLRKPAARGWANSLGYYANTKCSTETATASLVSTVHALDVPYASDGYVNLKVSVYGGSATSEPGSRGVVRYLTAAGDWTTERVLPSTLGWHSGYVRTASGMLYQGRNFAWGFYTGFGNRYDVQKFTVVVNYRTLG